MAFDIHCGLLSWAGVIPRGAALNPVAIKPYSRPFLPLKPAKVKLAAFSVDWTGLLYFILEPTAPNPSRTAVTPDATFPPMELRTVLFIPALTSAIGESIKVFAT